MTSINSTSEQSLSYYSERYSEACGKMIEKILSEFEYKALIKYFQAKSLSRYNEERFKSFYKQFIEYFRNALKAEIEKVNKRHHIDEALCSIFEHRQKRDILNVINSTESKKDVVEKESSYDLEKFVYDCLREQLEEMKMKGLN